MRNGLIPSLADRQEPGGLCTNRGQRHEEHVLVREAARDQPIDHEREVQLDVLEWGPREEECGALRAGGADRADQVIEPGGAHRGFVGCPGDRHMKRQLERAHSVLRTVTEISVDGLLIETGLLERPLQLAHPWGVVAVTQDRHREAL